MLSFLTLRTDSTGRLTTFADTSRYTFKDKKETRQ